MFLGLSGISFARQATIKSGRTNTKLDPYSLAASPSSRKSILTGNPSSFAIFLKLETRLFNLLKQRRLKLGPSKSKIDIPSSSQMWGARWPGLAVGVYILGSSFGSRDPSFIIMGESL